MGHSATITRIDPALEITREEWLQFVEWHPELILETPAGYIASARHVAGPRTTRLFWNNGAINCGAPTPEIIKVMFQCANELDASILGPRGHSYTSFEDWEKRTRSARNKRDENIIANRPRKRQRRLRLVLKLIVAAIMGILGYWFARGSE